MPLPHLSVDRLHATVIEACMSYERACRRRGVKLARIVITYEPKGVGFDMQFDEKAYPATKSLQPIIPVEDQDVDAEEAPLPSDED